jgi:thiol-disulfide isomerase/thioredoxin
MDEATPNRGLHWAIVAVAFLLFWCVCLAVFLPRTEHPSTPPAAADYNWKLLGLDDRPVDFAQYKGKTVFLNVWATWCGPCVREMPSIARLAAHPQLKDVAFVCASVDDSTDTVREFVAGKGWPMTILRATDVPQAFATRGIPATFIIAPDGRVVLSEIGSQDWDTPENIARLASLAKQATAMR